MATVIETIPAEERADFEGRLKVYGVNSTAVIQPDLVVPPGSTMTLSASDPKSFVKPHVLTTSSLAQLKSWIGVADTLFHAGKFDRNMIALPRSAVPPSIPQRGIVAGAGARPITAIGIAPTIPAQHLDDIRTAAAAYLFGDSQALNPAYQAAIEKYFVNFQILYWLFFTITVNAGSVLFIGPGQNVLSAWRIVIHQGGMVYAPHGNLKVTSTILQKA